MIACGFVSLEQVVRKPAQVKTISDGIGGNTFSAAVSPFLFHIHMLQESFL